MRNLLFNSIRFAKVRLNESTCESYLLANLCDKIEIRIPNVVRTPGALVASYIQNICPGASKSAQVVARGIRVPGNVSMYCILHRPCFANH